jgi:hypothetical protein
MSSVDFLVKLRDAAQMMADAANEQLEKMAPAETKYNEEDFNKLFWETKEGSKGPYTQTSKKATNNSEIFQTLQKIVKEHDGFWQSKTHKYWFHQSDQDCIDRRQK